MCINTDCVFCAFVSVKSNTYGVFCAIVSVKSNTVHSRNLGFEQSTGLCSYRRYTDLTSIASFTVLQITNRSLEGLDWEKSLEKTSKCPYPLLGS